MSNLYMITEHSNSLLTASLSLCFFLLRFYDWRVFMDLKVHHQRNMVKHLSVRARSSALVHTHEFAYAALNFRLLIHTVL